METKAWGVRMYSRTRRAKYGSYLLCIFYTNIFNTPICMFVLLMWEDLQRSTIVYEYGKIVSRKDDRGSHEPFYSRIQT